jgi:hypothetical protein
MDTELLRMEIERLRALVVAAYPYPPEGPLVQEMASVMDALPPGWEPPASLRWTLATGAVVTPGGIGV